MPVCPPPRAVPAPPFASACPHPPFAPRRQDWTGVDSMYFGIVTITTVGYGDLLPETDGAKIFTIFYAGYGCVVAAVSLMQVANFLIVS
jgi:hypothetical protein